MLDRNGNGNGRKAGGNGETKPSVRCAIYTRKSTDENLDNDFNSLDAQREAAENFIRSQTLEGWIALPDRYDDGAYSGATLERPALKRLMVDVEQGKIDAIVVYKLDRLSRSLLDFAKLIETLERQKVTLVSVTQSINTKDSSGRLLLNILLSYAQFEREVITERIRDKVAASKRRGKWLGGVPPLGYNIDRANKRLVVNPDEAVMVRYIFRRFLVLRSAVGILKELKEKGWRMKSWTTVKGRKHQGQPWNKNQIYRLLNNPLYIGLVKHKDQTYPGEHEAIIEKKLWDEVQAILGEDGKMRGNHGRAKTPALLSGLIRCGHCGTAMGITFSQKNNRTYRYYLCVKAAKQGYHDCPVKTLPAAEIEEAVIDQLRAVFRSPELVAATARNVQGLEEAEIKRFAQEKEIAEQQLQVLRAAANRLLQSGAGSNQSIAFIQGELSKLDADTQAAERQLRMVEAELAFYRDKPSGVAEVLHELTVLDDLWDELFPPEQERIIRLLVEQVLVYADRIEVTLRGEGLQTINSEMLPDPADERETAHAEP